MHGSICESALSTPSLGITHGAPKLSASSDLISAFNSLSRDHTNFRFSRYPLMFAALSTPSLGITFGYIPSVLPHAQSRFQLPLSGSPSSSAVSDEVPDELSTPSLGITKV